MTLPQEQHAQYGGIAIRMHPDNASGEEGAALVLTRHRAAPRTSQDPARQAEASAPQASTPRPAQLIPEELNDDTLYERRAPSSARRYAAVGEPQRQTRVRIQHHRIPVQRRVSQDYPFQHPQTPHAPRPQPRKLHTRPHWLHFVGGGVLCMFFGWIAFSNASSWWMTVQDDWHYGRPRTYQTDVVVGHHDNPADPSHFTVENFNRHVVIIEFQGGDPRKAVSYVGPTLIGPGQDLTPAIVSFRDVNHDRKPDMILQIQGSSLVFVNTGTAFRLATSADHVTL